MPAQKKLLKCQTVRDQHLLPEVTQAESRAPSGKLSLCKCARVTALQGGQMTRQ